MMIETGEGDLSVYDKSFWDLWFQKNLRNLASVKYQWMIYLYIPVIYGMFTEGLTKGQPWISATLGLGFLGGGFITLALGRMMANTNLKVAKESQDVNIHKQSIQRGQATSVIKTDNVDVWNDPGNILDTDK